MSLMTTISDKDLSSHQEIHRSTDVTRGDRTSPVTEQEFLSMDKTHTQKGKNGRLGERYPNTKEYH